MIGNGLIEAQIASQPNFHIEGHVLHRADASNCNAIVFRSRSASRASALSLIRNRANERRLANSELRDST
jgi:hypothetical protein